MSKQRQQQQSHPKISSKGHRKERTENCWPSGPEQEKGAQAGPGKKRIGGKRRKKSLSSRILKIVQPRNKHAKRNQEEKTHASGRGIGRQTRCVEGERGKTDPKEA